MNRAMVVLTAMVVVSGWSSVAFACDGDSGSTEVIGELPYRSPTEEAIACSGKSEGDACEFEKSGTRYRGVCSEPWRIGECGGHFWVRDCSGTLGSADLCSICDGSYVTPDEEDVGIDASTPSDDSHDSHGGIDASSSTPRQRKGNDGCNVSGASAPSIASSIALLAFANALLRRRKRSP